MMKLEVNSKNPHLILREMCCLYNVVQETNKKGYTYKKKLKQSVRFHHQSLLKTTPHLIFKWNLKN